MAELLSALETARRVWELADKGWLEADIAVELHQNLAHHFHGKRFLAGMPTDHTERRVWLGKRFHGMLRNYILEARRHGAYVREQFEATLRYNAGENVELQVRMTYRRMSQLTKAPSNEVANALIQRWREEDANPFLVTKVVRPSAAEIMRRASVFRCVALRKVALLCAGVTGEQVAGWETDDDRLYQLELAAGGPPDTTSKSLVGKREVLEHALKHLQPQWQQLIEAILDLSPEELDAFLDDYRA